MALPSIASFTRSGRRQRTATMGATLIALTLGGVIAGGAMALTPTVDTTLVFRTHVTFVENNVLPTSVTGNARPVFTVPPRRQFMVTDLVISNDSDTSPAANQFIATGDDANCSELVGGRNISNLKIPAGGTLHVPLVTGIRFVAGEIVCIVNVDGTDTTHWTISGYLFTRN